MAPCVGDCGGDGRVTVDDLVKGVNIALSTRPVGDCEAFDTDGNGRVFVNELVQGVRATLDGCESPASSPTETRTGTPEPTVTAMDTITPPPTPTATETPEPTAIRPNVIVINLDDSRADGVDRMPVLRELAADEHGGVTVYDDHETDAQYSTS